MTGPVTKPVTGPGGLPITGPVTKPVTKPVTRWGESPMVGLYKERTLGFTVSWLLRPSRGKINFL